MTSTTMQLADAYGNQRMTDGHHDLTEDHPHTLKARAALEQRIKELEMDAKRYRHMRSNATFQDRNGPGLYWYLPRWNRDLELGVRLDYAIDRAMSEAALTKAVEISQEYKLP